MEGRAAEEVRAPDGLGTRHPRWTSMPSNPPPASMGPGYLPATTGDAALISSARAVQACPVLTCPVLAWQAWKACLCVSSKDGMREWDGTDGTGRERGMERFIGRRVGCHWPRG